MRHRFAAALLVVVATMYWIAAVAGAADRPRRPNVVLIFADDLGYGDVQCFHPERGPFDTPNLDRMAAEGARLTAFTVPTPYCAPSRGSILTGRYPFRHTVVRNPAPDVGQSNFGLPDSEVTLAESLKSAGYATICIGKWHLGHRLQWLPRTQGFDEYLGILYSNDMFPVQLVRNETVVEYPVVQASLTRRYTNLALDFIEEQRDRPFFVYLAHAMPHKPLAASDDFYTPHTPDNLYADVMAELDHSVKRILDKLQELQLDERTLVMFTSDNGPWHGGSTGGLRGMKGTTWEGGYRVPFIARMPGTIPPGVVNGAMTASVDVFPTVCRLAGVSVPEDRTIDGRDILPLLQDADAPSPHDAVFGMHGKHLAVVRRGRWKLHIRKPQTTRRDHLPAEQTVDWVDPRGPDGVTILAPFEQPKPDQYPGVTSGDKPERMMLFDLVEDPAEQHNVASEHPQVVEELLALYEPMAAQIPELPDAPVDYLFRRPAAGRSPLMRLIGGDLRYDQIPAFQRHLLREAPEKADQPATD